MPDNLRLQPSRLGIAALAIVCASLCVAGILTYREWKQHQLVLVMSDEARQVLALNDDLIAGIRDAETGQRGYLLTGRLNYLDPFNTAVKQIPVMRGQLRELSRRDAELRRLLPQLEAAIDDKLTEMQATLDLYRSHGLRAALAVIQTDYGKQRMDRIRRISRVIQAGEEARWNSVRRDLESLSSRTFVITTFGTILLAVLVGGAGVALSRSASRMQRLVEELSDARRAAERTGDLLRATLYSIGDGVMTTDRNGAVQMMNRVAQDLTGYTEEEARGQSIEQIFRILNETTRAVVENPIRRVLKDGLVVGLANHTILVTKNGVDLPIDDSGAPIIDTDGSISGSVLVFRDVTERKQAEEAARRLAAIVDGSGDAIVGKTLDGIVTSWNRGAEKLFGYSAAEMVGTEITRVIPPDRIDEFRHILETIRSGNAIERIETARVTKDGRRILVRLTVSPVRNKYGEIIGVAKIAQDITRERQLEETLRQTQKMEAIGRLAGGVAHDFNNLLTVIVGYADLLRERPDNDEPARNAIEEIVRAAERASSLTGQLLAFSRRQIVQVQILDVNTLVRETQGMLTRLIGEDVDFALALDSSPCSIKIDSGQFTQVLMNLAVNARDAMPLGGKLTIETQVIDWQGDEIGRSTTRRAGRYVMLAVSDTGCGMDADTQAHIFEPFFTTKEAGKGTGLGLATVYGIVHQHGGWIDVYSEIQNGASFRAYFPWVGQATAIAGAEDRELAPRRSGTILIVEDQLPIRKLAEKVLTKAGHHVLSAPDGRAGLLLAQEYADNIDLLLTDIVMPVMSGPELAAHLSRLRPRMAVLFMSGYTDHALLHRGAIEQGTAFLQKPFRAEMLISKINELLSPDPSAAD